MKFKSLLLIAICYLPVAAFAQGSCSPDKIALLDTGRPAGGASIKVCPAGGTFPGCASSLFSDPTLSVGAANPVTADAHGNWGFCAAAGALYDYQISCTGCTTLTVHNFPLPPTTPIAAASVTSASANPANVGVIKLASGDGIDWRNNANSGNIQLVKTGAASGNVPADTFDMTASFTRSQAFIDNSANPSASGVVRCGNNTACVVARNAANSADVTAVSVNASNNPVVGKLTVTNPATGSTLTVADGKTLTANNSITLAGTDSTTMTFPNSSDTVLGLAATQSPTNKTFTSAGSGNTVTLLNVQGPSGALTGNAADQTVYTFTIPANTIQAGKGIRVTAVSKHTTGNGAVTYKLKLGATTLDSNAITGNANLGNDDWTYRIFNNSGVQNAQNFSRLVAFITGTSGGFSANNGTSAENTANSLALVYSFNAANTEQVTPVQLIVELVQ